MTDLYIGKGKLAGKGIYANRDFKKGEKVLSWKLQELSQDQFDALQNDEKIFVHSFWGKMYRFLEPACFTNHSKKPNTEADFGDKCDYASREIKRGEMITTNATDEFKFEVKTFLEVYENSALNNFTWLKGGYRNAVVSYKIVNGTEKILTLKRVKGNWRILNEQIGA